MLLCLPGDLKTTSLTDISHHILKAAISEDVHSEKLLSCDAAILKPELTTDLQGQCVGLKRKKSCESFPNDHDQHSTYDEAALDDARVKRKRTGELTSLVS